MPVSERTRLATLKERRQQAVQPAADRAAVLGGGVGGLELAQNLRLAHHHGIQAGGHAEQVVDGVAAFVPVEVRRRCRRGRRPCDRPGSCRRWPAGRRASSVVTVISTRLQVERITASPTPSRDFRSASAAGSVSSRKARHSRTSTGAVLWLTPVISSFIVSSSMAAQPRVRGPGERGKAEHRDGHDGGLAPAPSGGDRAGTPSPGRCPR